jgi:GntR family histidine utilization transcriptional repressor
MLEGGRVGFQEVKATVLSRIRSGAWSGGALLPTELDLAAEFGCSRATVNRALRELAEDGILDRRRRRGTRVVPAPPQRARVDIAVVRDLVEETGAIYRYALVERAAAPAPPWLAARMGLAEGAPVLHLRAVHYAGDAPFQYEDRWIALETVPDAAAEPFDRVGPNEWLLARVPFTEAEHAFSAVAADPVQAGFLAASPGAPLFQIERATWLEARPVTFARLVHRPGYTMRSAF